MLPLRAWRTISELCHALLILVTIAATGLSCVALLSQAVRNSPTRNWRTNFNALVIGASYVIVLMASILVCIKRRVAIRLRLHRISKSFSTIGKGDVPDTVHEYISQEYFRTCLVFHKSIPTSASHPGWTINGRRISTAVVVFVGAVWCITCSHHLGSMPSCYRLNPLKSFELFAQQGIMFVEAGHPINFRREMLSTIPKLDALARIVIPTHPPLKPHARMLHHFRFIRPLLSTDEFGLTSLHYYDSVVQIARMSSRELSQEEYELGRNAADEIITSLDAIRLDMEREANTGSQTGSSLNEEAYST